MTDASSFSIREHSEVLGSDGAHVGTVDHVDGDQIKLTKSDPSSGGKHHFIPFSSVASADANGVRLKQPASQVMANW